MVRYEVWSEVKYGDGERYLREKVLTTRSHKKAKLYAGLLDGAVEKQYDWWNRIHFWVKRNKIWICFAGWQLVLILVNLE